MILDRLPLRPLVLLCCALCATDCGAPTQEVRPDPAHKDQPGILASGEDFHVLAAWSEDAVLFGQAAKLPAASGREPWPTIFSASLSAPTGTPPTQLAATVYNLVIRRGRGAEALAFYMTPRTEGNQSLRSEGNLFLARPGQAPQAITPLDAPMVLQAPQVSPDNRYVLTYGLGPDPIFWTLVVTDLTTGVSRRLGFALSITPPTWVGFDRPGKRYVAFPNVEGYRPVALYSLEDESQPLVLPGRVAGLLADGRAVTEGEDLRAVELRRNGAQEVLAKSPVQFFSAVVRGGAVYYIAAPMGQVGPLYRIEAGQAPEMVTDQASYLWNAPQSGRVLYFADQPTDIGLNAAALLLPRGPNRLLSANAFAAYRPGRNDALFFFQPGGAGAIFFSPEMKKPVSFTLKLISAWHVSDQKIALIEQSGSPMDPTSGKLRLADVSGSVGEALAGGVDLLDSVERFGRTYLIYSRPKGEDAGVHCHPL